MSDPRVMGIGAKALTQPLAPQGSSQAAKSGKSFIDTFKESIQKVENQQQAADHATQDLAVGRGKTLHETMISVEQADISMRMMLAVRTQLVNAYHEVMRMQF